MSTHKLQATLETVTPLFLGGSDPRGQPELRAASFRGAMRFWLRALLGGVLGDRPAEIFQCESQVFGSTDHASPVVVRLEHATLPPNAYATYTQLTQNRAGIAYLFFGARSFGNEPERKAIASGCQFACTIRLRAGVQDLRTLQAAVAALWLLTHLGGLGMRARKGGGSLQVASTNWNDSSLPSLTVQAQTATQLQKALQDELHRLRNWAAETFNGSLSPTFQTPPAFDVLHPDWCSIAVVNREFEDWKEALDAFGQTMQRFRNRYEPDYSNVKAVLQGSSRLQPVQRAAFGLPIAFYFRSLNDKRATLEGEEHDRRASPLLVRVTKLANGKCVLVLTRFRSLFLPTNERLQLRYRERHDERKVFTTQPNETLLDEFLDRLSQQIAPRLEVTGW
jgi:CRISPR-associated protein Cmr1